MGMDFQRPPLLNEHWSCEHVFVDYCHYQTHKTSSKTRKIPKASPRNDQDPHPICEILCFHHQDGTKFAQSALILWTCFCWLLPLLDPQNNLQNSQNPKSIPQKWSRSTSNMWNFVLSSPRWNKICSISIDLVNMFLLTIATIRPTKQPPKLTKSQKHPPEMIKIHIQYVKLCAFITKMEQNLLNQHWSCEHVFVDYCHY